MSLSKIPSMISLLIRGSLLVYDKGTKVKQVVTHTSCDEVHQAS